MFQRKLCPDLEGGRSTKPNEKIDKANQAFKQATELPSRSEVGAQRCPRAVRRVGSHGAAATAVRAGSSENGAPPHLSAGLTQCLKTETWVLSCVSSTWPQPPKTMACGLVFTPIAKVLAGCLMSTSSVSPSGTERVLLFRARSG